MTAKMNCVPLLKALGDETRMRIISLLVKQPLGVNDLANRLGATQYNVSKHLRILREASLLKAIRHGKRREYVISSKFLRQLERNYSILDLGCCTFRFGR